MMKNFLFFVLVLLFPLTINADQLAKVTWIYRLGQCESGWSLVKHLDSNGYFSYDYLQFQMGTWLGQTWAGATKQNIHNPVLQIVVAEKMLDQGEFWRWKHCSAKTKRLYGPYPTN